MSTVHVVSAFAILDTTKSLILTQKKNIEAFVCQLYPLHILWMLVSSGGGYSQRRLTQMPPATENGWVAEGDQLVPVTTQDPPSSPSHHYPTDVSARNTSACHIVLVDLKIVTALICSMRVGQMKTVL